ncbi:peptidylprolyl isomerase [Winogradskyella maritima]|uniref:peptidylprolyl isomerase n=1 Tax=Winogradskyella maritima TaxID=1517766 RepID=A0ABV8AHU9_9FLAO|nr:peptidylprolyl isomerase [Winogradskyella maritima]
MRLPLLLCFLSTFAWAQDSSELNIETELDSISNATEANAFLKKNSKLKGKIVVYNAEKHKTKLADELFELGTGGKKTYKNEFETTHYKVIKRDMVPHYRASIIMFDSKIQPMSEINSLRSFILKGMREGGHDFSGLAKVYSKDRSAKTGGDLGWLKKGSMSKRFEKILADHKVGQVFSFDEPREKRHYVMLKSEADKPIEEITVLKITEKTSR